MSKEVNAQVQITSEFGKLASTAVGNYAQKQYEQALANNDTAGIEQWKEGGTSHVLLHTVVGALTGGTSGAAGAAASASSAEWMNNLQSGIQTNLQKAGLSEETATLTAKGIADLTAAGMGFLAGGTQGAASALATDANNRQLHPNDYTLAKALAAKSKGQYTEQQILDALRASGVKDSNGNVIVAEGTQETLINKNGTLTNINNGLTIQETYKEDKSISLRPSGQTALIEDAPVRPNNDLITFIIANTGGTASPFILTKGPTYTSSSSLVATPDGTQRNTVMVDGNAYFPLIATCPAANCTNGDPIANAIPDAGTQAYNEALAKKQEKDFNIATTVLGLGSTILRAVQVVDEIATAGMTANNVGKVGAGVNNVKSSVQANKAAGDAWEAQVIKDVLPETQVNIQPQITIRSNGPSGLKVRLDALGENIETGSIKSSDMKASQTAPFTPNQTIAYPELEIFGRTVVGKGKVPYVGGIKIPPTTVDIYRK
ncbi:hypothetical protein ACO0LB_13645 [Undibacterium sp. SXout7W]|uniref:hypothetical protein n=1 Tax=Undibacterium sp. SXout7W TaxID=3413049 RepID=UPI003BF3FEDA